MSEPKSARHDDRDGEPTVSYGYDDADRLTGITQGTTAVTLDYDAANRRTALTLPNGIVVEYSYDEASQLTGLTYSLDTVTLGTLTYAYDTAGRRTGVGGSWARTGLPAALSAASYDDANQIASWAGTAYTYDANGNLTSAGTRTYTWNARNQLTGLAGTVGASFAYDGFGRRTTKTVGGATTAFLYDGLNPVQELVGGSPSAVLLTGLGIDEFLVRTHGTGEEYFLTDALGSTLALADDTGAVETEYTYEPFGAFTTTGSGTSSAFAFTGREADGTGLYYYRARYYDPRLQRFVSEDPVGFAGGSNLFAYVGNRPTTHVDPLGLKPRSPFDDPGGEDGGSGSDASGGDSGPGSGNGPNPSPDPTRPEKPDVRPECTRGTAAWYVRNLTLLHTTAATMGGGAALAGAGMSIMPGLLSAGPAGLAAASFVAVASAAGVGVSLWGANLYGHEVHGVGYSEVIPERVSCR